MHGIIAAILGAVQHTYHHAQTERRRFLHQAVGDRCDIGYLRYFHADRKCFGGFTPQLWQQPAGGKRNGTAFYLHRMLQMIDIFDGLQGQRFKGREQHRDAETDANETVIAQFCVQMAHGKAHRELCVVFHALCLYNLCE